LLIDGAPPIRAPAMLLELSVADFAIIDQLSIPFEPGFNALTGETGAGKSIIIDALGAVLGERIGSDVVRTGAKQARVEATFSFENLDHLAGLREVLRELGIDCDEDTLILSREIAASGRSSARINGRAATAGMLSRLGAFLVDIHGQSDHLSLLRPAEHLAMLDRYAGVKQDRDVLAELVRKLRSIRERIADIEGSARERAQRADLLNFQVHEIQAAELQPGEEEELQSERNVLSNAERLAAEAARAYALLAGDEDGQDAGEAAGSIPALRAAVGEVSSIVALDESMQEVADRLEEQLYLLQDISHEVRDYRDRVEANPIRLEAVEERLDLIKQLERKYGESIAEVMAYGARAADELDALTGGESDVETMREQETELLASLGRLASALSSKRVEAAQRLAQETERAIADLNMGRARFDVEIRHLVAADGIPFQQADGGIEFVAVDETGVDRVEYLLAPNAGEALKPLARVASGGEMARLMLALKSILSLADETPTLVFDEIDVGVGGRSGQVVGEKLWGLAGGHQVIVITHLPQIAAFAAAHFRITKTERDERMTSRVELLSQSERVEEIAEMLDGMPVTSASRANAKALLARVDSWIESARGGVVSATPPG
jgi:DNA repair protein RecN (Recombination protein N)